MELTDTGQDYLMRGDEAIMTPECDSWRPVLLGMGPKYYFYSSDHTIMA